MFVISVGEKIVDMHPPWYVCTGENGCLDHCDADAAEGLSVSGTLYSLPDREPINREVPVVDENGNVRIEMEEAPVAYVREVDDCTRTLQMFDESNAQAARIADLETAGLDLADVIDITAGDTDAALVDLADKVEELNERIAALEG